MSTLSLPSWFDALGCEAQLVPEVRGFRGAFGGPTEVQDLLGDRWRFMLTMPEGDFTWGGRTAALFNRLRGGADWLRLHHLAVPAPRGTLRASPVLSGTMAQGAQSLSLSGAWTSNAVLAPQGLDSSVWTKQGCTITADVNTAPDGTTTADAIIEGTGDGGGSGHGVRQTMTLATGYYVVSWSVNAIERTRCSMWAFGTPIVDTSAAVYDTATMSTTGTGSPGITAHSTGTFKRCSRQITVSTAGSVTIHIGPQDAGTTQAYTGDGASRVAIWGVQIESGNIASDYVGRATLKAGDMLGHNSEQLFQVYEDCTATDLGAMTVTLVNRSRKSIASGQAIVWDKPGIACQLLDAGGVPTQYNRGRVMGQRVEFIEAWT